MRYESIAVLCQSYGSPGELTAMATTAQDMASGEIEILLSLDACDPDLGLYPRLPKMNTLVTPAEESRGQAWNGIAALCRADLLMMARDDQVFHSRDWDLRIRGLMQLRHDDGIFVAWTDDGTPKHRTRCQSPIISRRWYEALGYYVSESCGEFDALWLWDVGRRLDRLEYIDEILIETPEREINTSFEEFEDQEEERQAAADNLRLYMGVAK